MNLGNSLLPALMAMFCLLPSGALAQTHLCSYFSADIGQILGTGETAEKAFANAVEKCFDKRLSLAMHRNPDSVTDDLGEAIIDSCANLRCPPSSAND